MLRGEKIKIGLILGGTSPEREVSKSSAISIYKALNSLNYEVTLLDPAYGKVQPEKPEDFFADKDFTAVSNRNYVEAINSEIFDGIDLAFLALHGKWGEDGSIQSLLELRGIKYTGSNILSSAIAMDKHMSKILFMHYGIDTPKWLVAGKNDDPEKTAGLIAAELGFPCVIKPNDQGSTVGLTICGKISEVSDAISLALKYSDKALIEEFIEGREVTVGILDDTAHPVLEIKPKHGIYDYECKYTHGMSEYIVPAEIPDEIRKQLQEQSIKAFRALGCSVYGRVDFKLTGDMRAACLEVNTLPGMTSTSLVPKMAKAAGMTFEELIDKIIKLSL